MQVEGEAEIALIVMIGLPGAGKTWLASDCAAELERRGHAACVLSMDEFVPLQDQIGGLKESRGWLRRGLEAFLAGSAIGGDELSQNVARILQETVGGSTDRKKYIFLDDNNFYRSMRYDFFRIARSYGCAFAQIYVRCSAEEAIKRDSLRPCSVGREVIERMASRLEAPSDGEEWESKCSVWTSTDDLSVPKVVDDVLEACRYKVLPLPEVETAQRQQDRLICSANQIHAFDKLLRKFIGEYLLHPDRRGKGDGLLVSDALKMANLPKALAKCKKEILADARDGGLPFEVLRILDCSGEDSGDVDALGRFLVELFNEKLRNIAGDGAIHSVVP